MLELIERKAAGEEMVAPPAVGDEPDKVIDLMAALEASVAAAKEARGRHPTARKDEQERATGRRRGRAAREAGGQEAAARSARPRRRR